MGTERVAVVVGVGPGLGAATARRFAQGGLAVGLVARNVATSEALREDIEKAGGQALSVAADATDPASVKQAFGEIEAKLGPVDALVYNAGAFRMAGALELTPEDFEGLWKVNCFGGFLCAQAALPGMVARGRGAILFTGATASLRGAARFSGLAVGKFGLRALAQSLAREFGPRGIHVAHIVIDGLINTARVHAMVPGTDPKAMLSPEAIAETYWHLYAQDPTAWTHELDIRPATEKF